MMTLLAALPIVVLLVCLIFIKLSVVKSATISLGLALVIALATFGLPIVNLPIAVGKAFWLALFVSLIVWFAILLYHMVRDFKALEVINENLKSFIGDKFVAFLLLAWMFTGLLQGMSGFGVPAVVVTPILIALGYPGVKALAGALIGHSWAVTFGNLGAAYFVIQGITGVPLDELAHAAWVFKVIGIFLTGLAVCFVYDGFKGIKKGFLYVVCVSAVVAGSAFVIIFFAEAYPIASILPALLGLVTLFFMYKIRSRSKEENTEKKSLYRGEKLNIFQAALPYIMIVVLALAFQFIPDFVYRNPAVSYSPSFPGIETTLPEFAPADAEPHVVQAETNYNPIRVFRHPSFLLLAGVITAIFVYKAAGAWDGKVFKGAVQETVKKGIPATLALVALGTMSLIMMDSGMTYRLAHATADATQQFYPLFAPFIAVLSSFLTGNNTNANVLFGAFQHTVAYQQYGFNYSTMTGLQTMMAGVAVSIGPTLILMGALASDQKGVESTILKKLMPIVLLIALVMGIVNFLIIGEMPLFPAFVAQPYTPYYP